MNHFFLIAFALTVLVSLAGQATAKESLSLSRQDHKTLPATAYFPKEEVCHGVAVISHGAGSSENGYSYIGKAMSALGYLSVVVGHQESDKQALRKLTKANGLREGLLKLVTDTSAYRGRLMDIAAAKQWAATQCNATKSVLLGHSMGAATTLMVAGARNKMGIKGDDKASNAFDAYIALSPQGPGHIFPANAWADIKKPVLTLTGTRDKALGNAAWKTRTEPYLNMPAGCKWLGVINGATHLNFAGMGFSGKTEKLTTQTISAFLQGVDKGDCKAPAPQSGIDIQAK